MKSRGLLSSSLIYGFGAVANRLATLMLLPVFTAYLTPSDYGVVGLLSTMGMLLTPVFSFGLGTSIGVCYFATIDKNARARVIGAALMILLVSSMCLVLFGTFLRTEISYWVFGRPDFGMHVAVTILTVWAGLLSMPFQLRLQFEKRPIAFVTCSLLGLIGNLGLSYVGVTHFRLGAMGLLLGTALGQILTSIAYVYCGFVLLQFKDLISPSARKLFSLGLPMIPSFFLLFFLQNGVRWPLEWERGLHDVGLFTVGTNFGLAMTIFTGGVVAAWFPHAMSLADKWEQGRHELAINFLRYCALAGYLVLIFFVTAQPVVMIFADNAFFSAWLVIGLTALSQFFTSIFSLMLPPLYLANKVYLTLLPQIVASIVVAVLMLWLVQFGIVGAAFTVLIGAFVMALVAFLVIRYKVKDILPIPYNMMSLGLMFCIIFIGAALSFLLDIHKLLEFCILSSFILVMSAVLMARTVGLPLRVLTGKLGS